MADFREQRACIKFCFKLGKTATECYEMLKTAFGEQAMGRSQTFQWFSRFKAGRTSIDDDERSGRPVSSSTPEMIERVRQIIREDRRRTIDEVSMLVGISHGTCHKILTEDLKMRRVASKFVPRLLSVDQKQQRLDVCLDLKENAANDPSFLSNVITGDETWVYAYDPETKTQSSQWKSPGSPRPKKARQVRSNIKSMLICFFDQKGIVHKEFVPPGQTVNAAFYVEVLRRLRENVRRKRPDQWQNNTWLLHHDNAPAHAALLTRRFLTDNNMTVVPHPPYSPDLAPSDFFLFPKLKMKLKGRRFQTVEEIQAESQAVLNTLRENDFQECFKNWQRRWDRCQASEGDYFEGDAGP